MLTIKLKNTYRKNGGITFVYHVLGTDAELQAYKAAQTANGFYRQDDNEFNDFAKTVKNENQGKPLFYSVAPLADATELQITFNGRVVPNNTDQLVAEAQEEQSMIRQERAKLIAQSQMSGRVLRVNPFAGVPPAVENTANNVTGTGAIPGANPLTAGAAGRQAATT